MQKIEKAHLLVPLKEFTEFVDATGKAFYRGRGAARFHDMETTRVVELADIVMPVRVTS
ncbi:hypothetical protein [Rhodococcus sp. 06-156-3C]|uniref:hypothetical protein n=1 Tax=Rhodococcus sp. 06-156-3C TaxID=2022486 RepID=UPI001595A8AB|nr:hypothetical protein [Rhodococcus sp. 06-156-3C]